MSTTVSSSFDCSLPTQGVHFVRNPPVRGTLDIVWSCFAVLLLSTWETVLLDVPDHIPGSKWKRWTQQLKVKSVGMILTLFAPELTLTWALEDAHRARQVYRKGLEFATIDDVSWTLKHAYFATIYGFQLEYSRAPEMKMSHWDGGAEIIADVRTMSEDRESAAAATETNERLNVVGQITGVQLIYLRTNGWITSLPNISEHELDDKDKRNALVKFLAIMQIFWLVIQLITRATKGLSISQLEIIVVAFAALSILTRAISWQCPRDVRVPIRIKAARELNSEELEELREVRKYEINYDVLFLAPTLTGVIFGGIHCFAWNETFPTSMERLLWRMSSILTTALPIIWICVLSGADKLEKHWNSKKRGPILDNVIDWATYGLYGLARLIIMIEAFRSLFFLPQDAFIATWATSFPHLG